jgi:hypothetical protein
VTTISCKKCKAAIPSEQVESNSSWVRCDECHTLFKIHSDEASTSGPSTKPKLAKPRLRVSMPKRIHVDEVGGTLFIARSWRGLGAFAMIPFCLFWNGFIVMWFTTTISNGAGVATLFGAVHAATGIYLLYSTIAKLFNTTTITVGGGLLRVQHKPIPWPGALTATTSEIDQLYCHEKVRRNKNTVTRTYEIHASLQGGIRTKKLISGLSEADQALFLEQEIEEHLEIVDQNVPGSYVG